MLIAFMPLATSCDDRSQPSTGDAPATTGPRQPEWQTIAGSAPAIGVQDEAVRKELEAAMKQARQTADNARRKWQSADDAGRQRWAIKWAAPIAGDSSASNGQGAVEYVWVKPLHWSRWRIEGTLASEPLQPIIGNKHEGDLVSFPAEELADWIHMLDPQSMAATAPGAAADTAASYEGGYTVAVLSRHYGEPGQ